MRTWNHPHLVSNLLKLALPMILAALPVRAAPRHWVHETVDQEKVMGESAAALDAQDYAHIVYGRDALYYDWQDAAGWHSEVIDADSAPGAMALAIDSSMGVHVAYTDLLQDAVKVAEGNAGGWTVETVAHDAWIQGDCGHLALCLDGVGRPHVAYAAGDYYEAVKLQYLHRDGAGWQVETVRSWTERRLYNLAVSVAGNGEVHLACTSYAGSDELLHAWRGTSGWQSVTRALPSSRRVFPPIQFDSTGRLHMLYVGAGSFGYLLGNRGRFQVEPLLENAYLFGQLAVDGSGAAHIIHYGPNFEDKGLRYWTNAGGSWQATTVDEGYAYDARLAHDPEDRPFVLYRAEGDVQEVTTTAWLDAEGWHTSAEPVTLGADLGEVRLLLTRDRQPRVLVSTKFEDPATTFYARGEDGWEHRRIAQESDNAFLGRLCLDAGGRPHIAYTVGYSGQSRVCRYAWRDGSGWHIDELEGTHNRGPRTCDLALDDADRPHIACLATGTGAL
ncbi:MAG: hypothetical protein ACK2U9_13315, partial [Anaerolineae bacterium]